MRAASSSPTASGQGLRLGGLAPQLSGKPLCPLCSSSVGVCRSSLRRSRSIERRPLSSPAVSGPRPCGVFGSISRVSLVCRRVRETGRQNRPTLPWQVSRKRRPREHAWFPRGIRVQGRDADGSGHGLPSLVGRGHEPPLCLRSSMKSRAFRGARCLPWVISRHCLTLCRCPLYP